LTAPAFPRMPWYPRDFACATRTWPLVARGVYRELLDAQWDLGGSLPGVLPDDPDELREIARVNEAEWKVAWRYVAPKFPRIEGGRQNARLEEHRQLAMREYLGRRKGAERTNAKRWGADRSVSQSATRSATGSPNRSATENSPDRGSLSDK
jgi:uncharacterized protein YdaU (DUF1376 family)